MTLTLSAEGKAVSNAAVDVSLSTSGQWLFTFMIRAPSGDEDIKVQIDVGVAAASAASGGLTGRRHRDGYCLRR